MAFGLDFGFGSEGLSVNTARTMANDPAFQQGSAHLQADIVVVGSGAGGSMAAYRLALAGYKVIVLDAGKHIASKDMTDKLGDAYTNMYAQAGLQFNKRGDVNILQGSCIGGSSVVGGTLTLRAPDEILNDWVEQTGLDFLKPENMAVYYGEIERQLKVADVTPKELDKNSLKAISGSEEMRLKWRAARRNVRECAATGHCLSGCKSDRKTSALISYLPWASSAQAEFYADSYVKKVTLQNGRATGVDAVVIDPNSGLKVLDLRVDAPLVVVAAGAIQTPQLLKRSEVPDFSNMIGQNLALNPFTTVVGEYAETVNGSQGIYTGMYIDENLRKSFGGALLVAQMGAPVSLIQQNNLEPAAKLNMLKNYSKLACINAYVMDRGLGNVDWKETDTVFGKQSIDWELGRKEFLSMKRAVSQAARIHFSAGAERVYLPAFENGVVESVFELDAKLATMEQDEYPFVMQSHAPQGTCRLHAEKSKGVVSSIGEVNHAKGVFVTDASLFPSSLPVPPELTVYALASYISDQILTRDKDYFLPSI